MISSSSAWAHGVLVDPGAVHVCYCHNPFRYAWTEREATLAARNPLTRPALRAAALRWRQWDWIAAQRVDAYVANSAVTAARIRRYFGRESTVLHPPVELSRFSPGPVGEHYLVLAELMAHKRIDVAVRAFNALRRPLVVVGDGPEYRRLKRLAGTDRAVHRPALGRRRRRSAAHRAGARGHRRGGIRDRRGRVAGHWTAGDRAAGRGRSGDGHRRGSGASTTTATTRQRSRRPSRASMSTPSTHRVCEIRTQIGVGRFQDRLRTVVAETAANERHTA